MAGQRLLLQGAEGQADCQGSEQVDAQRAEWKSLAEQRGQQLGQKVAQTGAQRPAGGNEQIGGHPASAIERGNRIGWRRRLVKQWQT